jgi:putative serine protease PepD
MRAPTVPPVAGRGCGSAAGLRQGDIITAADGEPVTDPNQLEAITLTKRPGDSVSVANVRDGHSTSTTVTLGTQP